MTLTIFHPPKQHRLAVVALAVVAALAVTLALVAVQIERNSTNPNVPAISLPDGTQAGPNVDLPPDWVGNTSYAEAASRAAASDNGS
ncbi:MAG: hypothetical protein ACR2PK_14095 [Acidimicrobiales bacterium]